MLVLEGAQGTTETRVKETWKGGCTWFTRSLTSRG